jgi:nitroreductase
MNLPPRKLTPYQTRYGSPIRQPHAESNSFIDDLLVRSSVKRFDSSRPLPPGTLQLLIAAAQSASTSGMLQTWSVLALETKEDKERIYKAPHSNVIIGDTDTHNHIAIDTCSVLLIWLADLTRIEIILKTLSEDPNVHEQMNRAEYHLKAIIDATIAAQTCFMAAETLGLTGTYCGAIRQLPIEFLAKEFNLPKYTFPIFGMMLGYPAARTPVKPRLPQELVLHRGSYKPIENVKELEKYDKVLAPKLPGKHFRTYEDRVLERMAPSLTKSWMGDSLKVMGFNFK